MANQTVAVGVINTGTAVSPNQTPMQITLVNPDGTAAGTVKKAAAQVDTVAADLAALKVDFNLLLAKLRTAGVIAP
jgi:hypothetical protein